MIAEPVKESTTEDQILNKDIRSELNILNISEQHLSVQTPMERTPNQKGK